MMNDVLEAILFYDDLSSDQQQALFAALDADPALARSFKEWRAIQHQVKSSISTNLPDRELLVLHAIAEEDPSALTLDEQVKLKNGTDNLSKAFEQHPALMDVVKDVVAARADFLTIWDDFESANSENSAPKSFAADRAPVQKTSRRVILNRLATVFVLLAVITTAGILTWRSQNLEIVKTSPGEFRIVELNDGSTVRLFGKSRISYSKHNDQFASNRSVELKGRAFFDIAPNTNPFTVQTATALTEATGTKFSIEANRSLTKVILTAGQVAVASRQRKGDNIMLSPGEMSQIPRRKQPSEPVPIAGDLTDMLSWTGLLVFHDTPLEEVAAHLSKHYDVSVTIDPLLIEEQWVATYDPDTLSVNEILDNLATTLGAVVETTGDDAYLLSR